MSIKSITPKRVPANMGAGNAAAAQRLVSKAIVPVVKAVPPAKTARISVDRKKSTQDAIDAAKGSWQRTAGFAVGLYKFATSGARWSNRKPSLLEYGVGALLFTAGAVVAVLVSPVAITKSINAGIRVAADKVSGE